MVSEGSNLLPAVPKNMKEYNARRRLKQAGYAIIAIGRLNKIVKNWKNNKLTRFLLILIIILI